MKFTFIDTKGMASHCSYTSILFYFLGIHVFISFLHLFFRFYTEVLYQRIETRHLAELKILHACLPKAASPPTSDSI